MKLLVNIRTLKTFSEKQTSLPFQMTPDSFTQYIPRKLTLSGFLKQVNLIICNGFYPKLQEAT